VTLNPSSSITEAEQRPSDSEVLLALRKSLRLRDNAFMTILGQAFSLVWGTSVQCRMGCEVWSHHGNQRIALVDPGSDRCGIIVVTSLATLLQANRGSRLVTLQLGLATQHPASLVVEAPVIPKAPLYDLIHSADPALRLIPLEGSTDPGLFQPHIVIGLFSSR